MEFPKVFRPREEGLSKIFGELEADIMEVIWRRGDVTVKDVFTELHEGREIAYTTVMTVVGRLADKGMLTKTQTANKYVYCPACTRDEMMKQVSKDVLQGLMDVDRAPVMAHLTGIMDELDRDELELLKRELDRTINERQEES